MSTLRAFLTRHLDTSGARVHAGVLLAAAAYVAAHVFAARRILDAGAPVTSVLVIIIAMTAVGQVFMAVPVWVYSILVLIRGPKPLVRLPEPVSDDELPWIVVQIPGRHEPLVEIENSVTSVLEADYPPDKLTVQFVDNSDDDRWRAVAARYADEPRVSVEHREGTVGFKAGNLLHGLSLLGPFEHPERVVIGLLDVGDTFAPEVVRPMATELVRDLGLGFVQGMFRSGNTKDTIISWSDGLVGDAARRFTEGYAAHYGLPTMNGHCALLRLSALNAVGGWDVARIAEDWATGIEMIARGWRGKWVDYDPRNPRMISTELVPGEITAQQKQKRRWALGGAELTRYRLRGWLRSRQMPWYQRLALLLRLGANLTVVPTLIAQVVWPLWLTLALVGGGGVGVLGYGLFAMVLQNPFFLANAIAALNYVREGRARRAGRVLLAYPIQALWRLPLTLHAFLGFVEGIGGGLVEFVITPKKSGTTSLREALLSQRPVVAVSFLPSLPLMAAALAWPERVHVLVTLALACPILTIVAVLLVPWTQRHGGWPVPGERPAIGHDAAPDEDE